MPLGFGADTYHGGYYQVARLECQIKAQFA
jgi:hypothetical protein